MTRRSERVAEEIRESVARMIVEELKDPRIGFVTVTRVDVTPDLHLARIFVGVLGGNEQRKATLAALKKASPFVRRMLGQRLRMRYTPDVLFEYDKGLDATERVAQLLNEAEKTAAPATENDPQNDD
ncbi:MAG: 30S ribosome-binding factor RbfA [Vicinamibacteria bacterium]|nr:30S ribosome-binding factor RbfA [Vicinamibacteria bacterium]